MIFPKKAMWTMKRLAVILLGTAIAASPAAVAAPVAPNAVQRPVSATPNWFADGSPAAARQLVQLLATSQVEGLNPKRYNVRGLSRAVDAAASGNPMARMQAEQMLNQALVAYVRDSRRDPNVGVIYVDAELRPAPPSPAQILADAAAAPSMADYVAQTGWMNPVYGQLRQALSSRMYRNANEERLLRINMERARVLPAGGHRYIIVNTAAQRLYMYEGGVVVDSMRVVAGKPETQTPMMNAYLRYVALNPYWNVPPETAAHNLAPKVLKEGRSYFTNRGYQVFSDWSDNAKPIDPMSINWNAVAAGTLEVRMRQKPGPANSMGKMKFMFPNKQGIWLHDTPVQEKIDDPARLQSGGCVRLEDAARLQRWI
ncbi:MAG: L,D-transpeptidase family protein, partial [Sphingomicrobium sp.]